MPRKDDVAFYDFNFGRVKLLEDYFVLCIKFVIRSVFIISKMVPFFYMTHLSVNYPRFFRD